jgi:choline-sulfatase
LIFAGPGVNTGRCNRPAELLDMYPTLAELCGLPKPGSHVEGISLVPQLKDANAPRERPAITTHNHDNHGVRSEKWRYIQYADGSQELYNMIDDPNEWENLAADSKYADVIASHKKWIPKSVPPAAGSKHRILIYKDGQANWETKDIGENDPIPEI